MRDFESTLLEEDYYWYNYLYRMNWVSAPVAIIFGLLMVFAPLFSLYFLLYAFGAYLIISSIISIVIVTQFIISTKVKILQYFKYVIIIFFSFWIFFIPDVSVRILFYLFGFWLIFNGLTEIVTALWLRRRIQYPFIMILVGTISLLFGIVILLWPEFWMLTTIWLVGLFFIIWGSMGLFNMFYFKNLFYQYRQNDNS